MDWTKIIGRGLAIAVILTLIGVVFWGMDGAFDTIAAAIGPLDRERTLAESIWGGAWVLGAAIVIHGILTD